MRSLSKYIARISLLLLSIGALASDEENYHQLGRDYVTCKWNIEIPQLKSLSLKDRAILHELAQEACSRWRSQNRQSVWEPRVERAFELAPEALASWRCHALERFSRARNHSGDALLLIHHMKAGCTGEIPIVTPKKKLHTWLSGHYDTLILFGSIFLFQKIFGTNLDTASRNLKPYRFLP